MGLMGFVGLMGWWVDGLVGGRAGVVGGLVGGWNDWGSNWIGLVLYCFEDV